MRDKPHWSQYKKFNDSALANVSRKYFEEMIAKKSELPEPYIDSSVEINEFLKIAASKHDFHRQFNEQFEGFNKESVLGIQLYEMLHPKWKYGKTQKLGHKYENSVYWL